MNCGNCGAAAAAGETRCASCGAPLGEAQPSPQPPSEVAAALAASTDPPQAAGTAPAPPAAGPWPRYWARACDVTLWALVLALVGGVLVGLFAPSALDRLAQSAGRLEDQLLALLLLPFAMALDALTYALFGNTPGKWLAGLRVADLEGRKLSLGRYTVRNLGVYVYGLALGLGLIGLFTLIHNFNRVRNGDVTSWDERAQTRTFRVRGGLARTCLAAGAYLLLVLLGVGIAHIPEPTPEETLQYIANSVNKDAPRMLDETTRLDRVFIAPGPVLQYDYTLLAADEEPDAEVFKQRIREQHDLVKTLCEDLADLKEYGAGLRFRYADRANHTILTLEASQADCRGRH